MDTGYSVQYTCSTVPVPGRDCWYRTRSYRIALIHPTVGSWDREDVTSTGSRADRPIIWHDPNI
jgi:hypothetical protein